MLRRNSSASFAIGAPGLPNRLVAPDGCWLRLAATNAPSTPSALRHRGKCPPLPPTVPLAPWRASRGAIWTPGAIWLSLATRSSADYRVGAPNYREGVPVADITAYAVTVLQVHRVAGGSGGASRSVLGQLGSTGGGHRAVGWPPWPRADRRRRGPGSPPRRCRQSGSLGRPE